MTILKCAIYNCENKATEGYPACSKDHGYTLRTWKEFFEEINKGYSIKNQGLDNTSVGEIEYYFARYGA